MNLRRNETYVHETTQSSGEDEGERRAEMVLPAGEGRPDEVVVGEPVVEDRDERLPLRVALVHRRPRAASLLHLRRRRLLREL